MHRKSKISTYEEIKIQTYTLDEFVRFPDPVVDKDSICVDDRILYFIKLTYKLYSIVVQSSHGFLANIAYPVELNSTYLKESASLRIPMTVRNNPTYSAFRIVANYFHTYCRDLKEEDVIRDINRSHDSYGRFRMWDREPCFIQKKYNFMLSVTCYDDKIIHMRNLSEKNMIHNRITEVSEAEEKVIM